MPSSFYLSAAHKSSGKTVISLGLCAAYKSQNLKVQPFKKGPDYIDPIWLSTASSASCYNLHFYNMTNKEIKSLYLQHSNVSDITIIEGNKGLFDGMSTSGGDANADMAKLLDVPVVLTIDTTGITRGVAPLVKGYQDFDTDVKIAGVILNKVAGQRHESKLVQAIEHYTDIKVLGSVYKSKDLMIDERHLGLMPANESPHSEVVINKVANIVKQQVDLDAIKSITSTTINKQKAISDVSINSNISVAVAKDKSFGFYYQDDIDSFKDLGVKVKYFNTLKDYSDALFIGGGFPEMNLKSLSGNTLLLNDIKQKISQGMPTYAECGGLMYLTNSIAYEDNSYPMAGVINADTQMTIRPIGRGYVELEPTDEHPWSGVSKHIYAHEFHYSKLINLDKNTRYAFKVLRGVGVDNMQDGIVKYNMLASYTHLRNVYGNRWVEQFVNFIKQHKQ